MNVGVLKERKQDEHRVALRPAQVESLIGSGHRVYVEFGAGSDIGYDDESYAKAGARMLSQKEVYERAELLVKVKCPLPEECGFLQPHHVLFAYLHFDENIPRDKMMQIVGRGLSGIAYEWVEKDGLFPLLQPMSELTGAVYARKSMDLLITNAGLLGGCYQPGWPVGQVMIIGGGHIGANAINVFAANHFKMVIVDKHPETLESRVLRYVPAALWAQAGTEIVRFDESRPDGSVKEIVRRLPEMDIVICAAVRRPTLPKEKCEYLIRRADVATMRRNRVICDATACDREFIETAVSSDSLSLTYVEEGIVHYNCDHVPSLVAHTATTLLTEATFPYVQLLAQGFQKAVKTSPTLAKGVMCHQGRITHEYSAKKKQLEFTPLVSLLR